MSMTKNQNIVMWCGLVILCVYLFTDKSFKAAIFGKTANASPAGGGNANGIQLASYTSTTTSGTSAYWGYPTGSAPTSPKVPTKASVPAKQPKGVTLL